jgi:hypothetical protein
VGVGVGSGDGVGVGVSEGGTVVGNGVEEAVTADTLWGAEEGVATGDGDAKQPCSNSASADTIANTQ